MEGVLHQTLIFLFLRFELLHPARLTVLFWNFLKAGVWFRRGRLFMLSPDSRATACPPSGRNSTYRPVQISGTGSDRQPHVGVTLKDAEALREAFERWLGRHWGTIVNDGGYGDVVQLFVDLKAASPNF